MEYNELMEKAKQANSPEELLALAKENNVELTQEQAEAFFEKINKSGVLSDDELDNVAGGCGGSDDDVMMCPQCGKNTLHSSKIYGRSGYFHEYICDNCYYHSFGL